MSTSTEPTPPSVTPSAWAAAARSAAMLALFALIFTALMAATHEHAAPRIAAAQEAEALRLVRELLAPAPEDSITRLPLPPAVAPALDMPGAATYFLLQREGRVTAIVLPARDRRGYGGEVVALVAFTLDDTLLGARIAAHHETPGLGDYIDPARDRNKARPWIAQFAGQPLTAAPWAVRKDGGTIDAHTGATISARAATSAINRAVQAWRQYRKELLTPRLAAGHAPAAAPGAAIRIPPVGLDALYPAGRAAAATAKEVTFRRMGAPG